ncbi:hypothetical protein [Myxosarcina sp. GI1]|nr:hypothetical protein [Myxosarcina sp. GI1]
MCQQYVIPLAVETQDTSSSNIVDRKTYMIEEKIIAVQIIL